MDAGQEINMDEAKQDQQGGAGLYTLGLACCIGIAVTGTYTRKARPGQVTPRHDAFLAHLADGPAMEETWQSLKSKVDRAKKNGLSDLRVTVCVVDPSTLKEDTTAGMCWSRAVVDDQRRLNDEYVNKAAGLQHGGEWLRVDVRRHHINREVDMLITKDRKVSVRDA